MFIPPLAALFRDFVTPTVAGLMTLVLLRVDLAQVLGYLRRPALVGALTAWLLLVMPVIAYGIATACGMDGPLGAALVISNAVARSGAVETLMRPSSRCELPSAAATRLI